MLSSTPLLLLRIQCLTRREMRFQPPNRGRCKIPLALRHLYRLLFLGLGRPRLVNCCRTKASLALVGVIVLAIASIGRECSRVWTALYSYVRCGPMNYLIRNIVDSVERTKYVYVQHFKVRTYVQCHSTESTTSLVLGPL